MTCTITFRAKKLPVYGRDDKVCFYEIKVPKITTRHCDMNEFRASERFGGYANSALFPAMLARALSEDGILPYIALTNLPDNVTVKDGYLTEVTIKLKGTK